jgi:hypothetical protein
MNCQGGKWRISLQDLANVLRVNGKKKFIVIQKGNPAGFMLMMSDTVLICLWGRGRVRPLIQRDDSLIPIRREGSQIIVGAVVVIEIEMLEPNDLMKFNPFRQVSRGILEFQRSR